MMNKLKVFRAQCDWTQQALAERVGVSRQTIHAIEKGNYVPSAVLAMKIAFVFDASVEEVFQLENQDWQS